MSREQLADAGNRALGTRYANESRMARWAGLTAGHIGTYERGETRWPNEDYRWALCTVLGATEAELGFYIDRPDHGGASLVTRGTASPRTHHRDTNSDRRQPDDGPGVMFRRSLLNYRWSHGTGALPLAALEAAVHAANLAYQSAQYAALDSLPEVIAGAEQLVVTSAGHEQRRAYHALTWANLIASKLASKLGDGLLAWLTADRAACWVIHLDDPALSGVAAYQSACALGKTAGRERDGEEVAIAAADHLGGHRSWAEPGYLSVRGALLLHAAVTAARRGDRTESRCRLDMATNLADQLGHDGNEHWTAFGPTNVLLHRLAAAVALGDATEAVRLGDHIDTSGMPPTLLSRRAQVHIDLATLHCQTANADPQAVLHLLEAERIAPQVVGRNADARQLVTTLLGRERRSATPGLRPLAQRAGVAA